MQTRQMQIVVLILSRNDTGAADHGKVEPRDDDSRFSQIGGKRPLELNCEW